VHPFMVKGEKSISYFILISPYCVVIQALFIIYFRLWSFSKSQPKKDQT